MNKKMISLFALCMTISSFQLIITSDLATQLKLTRAEAQRLETIAKKFHQEDLQHKTNYENDQCCIYKNCVSNDQPLIFYQCLGTLLFCPCVTAYYCNKAQKENERIKTETEVRQRIVTEELGKIISERRSQFPVAEAVVITEEPIENKI